MVDHQTVCCMCGDIGFPDKLFRCTKCRNRFQHSYCSNYYNEFSEKCDWCQSEERTAKRGVSSKKAEPASGNDTATRTRPDHSGDKIKQNNQQESTDKGKSMSTASSPRPTTRRYKLLKDVMS